MKHAKSLLCLVLLVIFFGCQKEAPAPENQTANAQKPAGDIPQPQTAFIVSDLDSDTVQFAKQELENFLTIKGGPVFNSDDKKNADIVFQLKTDPQMEPYSFSVKASKTGDQVKVTLAGHDETCVLHSVYTLLENLGYSFHLSGPIAPNALQMDKIAAMDTTINPAIRLRGPRPYMNFPMDLSSYPLDEALEHIRNLARMRLNMFSFHTYRWQWYEYLENGAQDYAGHFFYGNDHIIPDNALLKEKIRFNQKYYCIPSIEAVYEDKPQRSKRTIEWMGRLLDEAKRMGMHTQVSMEPGRQDKELEDTLSRCEAIAAQYPQLDTIEIVTVELGGWRPAPEVEDIKKLVVDHFGEDMLEDEIIKPIIKEDQSALDILLGQMGHNIKAANALHEKWKNDPSRPSVAVGVYCSIPKYIKAVFHILRTFTDDSIVFTTLPGHGAYIDYKNLRKAQLGPDDYQRTMIIQWLELDANMYTLQNSINGLYHAINDAVTGADGQSIYAMSFIYWRTIESEPSARYFSLSAIHGAMDRDQFYKQYASEIGVKPWQSFAETMKLVDRANEEVVDSLCISFCFLPCWGQDTNFLKGRTAERQVPAREMFEQAIEALKPCAQQTTDPTGLKYLKLIENRIRGSILYFRAFEKAHELAGIVGDNVETPENMTDEQKSKFADTANQVLLMLDQFMELTAEQTLDRGCEGNLISFYHTAPAYIKMMREKYAAVPFDDKAITDNPPDSPPMPIIVE